MDRNRSNSGEPNAFLEIAAALGKWYDATPDIRRLRATQQASVIHVLIALEPTADDDDTLPIWLAKSSRWMNDLQSLTNRDMHLEMSVSAAFDESPLGPETPMITELSWRDSSASRWLSQ